MHHRQEELQEDLAFYSAFFSDETELFRSPCEPEPGHAVTVRIRVPQTSGLRVRLVTDIQPEIIDMKWIPGSMFDMYEAEIFCGKSPVSYYFLVEHEGARYIYRKNGLTPATREELRDPQFDFRFTPGFHTPAWARGAVQYQIFPDRFCNGDSTNDVRDGEYSYNGCHVRHVSDWYAPPAHDDYRCFYGGDIAGILEKLDYLEALGVEVIYLNPIFLSPSSHKYDTQDYDHIDPHLGVISEHAGRPMNDWEHHNGFAEQYISRVLSKKNLADSDALFAKLCGELHRRGMRIILDGVFNHCGSFHRWMDSEGIYREKPGYKPGAFQSKNSPYRGYFRFQKGDSDYEAWWSVRTLPKLYYEQSPELCEAVFSIAEKWLRPPYSIDGWRLDVAADLGHSLSFNHKFWREFRRRVKAVNPNAIILAEHYGDAAPWLQGDQWDTVMNYDAFMEPVTGFLTGMEKHSDDRRDAMYQNGTMFFDTMRKNMARFQCCSLYCAMNELSNHDHSRFLTRTNRRIGRTNTVGAKAAGEGIQKSVMREAVVIQMTWPGAPTIYYGDEAGLVGWTDPDNRRTYPWGREDKNLIELHRVLTSYRKKHPVLRTGSVISVGSGFGNIAFARFDKDDCIVTACNNLDAPRTLTLNMRDAGVEDGDRFTLSLLTDEKGFSMPESDAGKVELGTLKLSLPAKSSAVLSIARL